MFWNLAVVRGFWGFFGSILSLYARYFDQELRKNIVLSRSELSYFLVLSFLGFFIFEWTAQIYFDIRFKTFSQALHAHHLVAFQGYFLTMWDDKGHFTAVSGFVDEMSTPFSCKNRFFKSYIYSYFLF
jgi:ceroid-lipofuscinosis protein 8